MWLLRFFAPHIGCFETAVLAYPETQRFRIGN
jgi:hypothetical protein